MTRPFVGFEEFCRPLAIPSRDHYGMKRMWPLFPSQAFLLEEFRRGLSEGVHDFLVLKGGRQSTIGGSTLMDALTLFYLQSHSGMVGMMASDEDDNRDYRRDVMLTMIDSLPVEYRQAVRRDNARMLAWLDNPATGYLGSRLLFAAAGKRKDSNLGRSKGINYNYNDEFGFWSDDKAYLALRASRSEVHPLRLYVDISTANGVNSLMHEQWKSAQTAITRRAIFVSCWRNQDTTCRITEAQAELWERYGVDAPSSDELGWMREVQRRYGVTLTREFFCWYRWKTQEDFGGDETMMAQEYGILPEECFQSFGDRFIPGGVIQRLQRGLAAAPRPKGYRYVWAPYLTDTRTVEDEPATAPLRVWQEPDSQGVYIVAAHPWGSTSPNARESVVQVWRAWTDGMRLVAEYADDDATTPFQLCWVFLHLCGAYGAQHVQPYGVYDVGMAGGQFLAELQRFEIHGYGLPPGNDRERIMNMMGSIRYLYKRLDTFGGGFAVGLKIGGSLETRARVLYQLRDELVREHLEVWSPETVDQLASLRRGEVDDDADAIGGGRHTEEARAVTAAMAVEAMMTQAMADLARYAAPRDPEEETDRVENLLVKNFLPWMVGGGR